MKRFFVPYNSGKPVIVTVNGHRLVLLSRDSAVISEGLGTLGGDSVKRLRTGQTKEEEDQFLEQLAKQENAGVVIAPHNLRIETVIASLESQLPWLQ